MGSILYQKIVPPDGGGDTLFASATRPTTPYRRR